MHKIFSVDDHIIEPPDVWTSRLPAKYRDVGPRVVAEDGREFWRFEDQQVLTVGINAVAGKPREQWNVDPTRFTDMIPGCYDPKARARDLLSQGVLASISFPTLPRFGGMLFNSFQDKELADLCVKAWNDFVLDEWCPAGPPGLFVPMVICQVWDPALAAAEIRRCAGRGAKAVCFVENPVPDGLPGFHTDHWDPIWDAAQEAGLPVCMHIASSGFVPMPDPKAPVTSLFTLFIVTGMLSMVNLLNSPVCHNFPELQVVFSEASIGWIPALLERLDRQVERHGSWIARPGVLRPSDIFRRNMYVCMVEEPIGLSLHDLIGVDRILAETDYPHSDTTYPHVQRAFDEIFAGIPPEVVTAVSHANAERLFDWRMADESLLSSPDIVAWRRTLEQNPHAATEENHSVTGIDELDSAPAGPGDPCRRLVVRSTQYLRCGAIIGPAGRCENGHELTTSVGPAPVRR